MKVRALIIVAVMLAFAASAWAVTPVDCSVAGVKLVPLNSFAAPSNFKPKDVAVSPVSGKIFTVDTTYDKVTVFSRDGKALKYMSKITPYGVAVDDAGNVYIGWAQGSFRNFNGEVDVYDEALNFQGSLGQGWGEFSFPDSIATDNTRVFVVDGAANLVKVYDRKTRKLLTSFGGDSSANVSLLLPTGIAVTSDGTISTIYVTDSAKQYDSKSGYGIGAGAYIFSIDANNNVTYINRFVTYGNTVEGGVMGNAAGVAIDGSGRVMVTDSTQNDFQVFDATGNYICTHKIEDYGTYPKGMDFSAEGKLMVAGEKHVYRYGIDNYTDMAVSPPNLTFNGQLCSSLPAAQDITVANNGEGPVNWNASEGVSWLSLSATSGTVAKGGADTIAATVDTTGMSAGTYTGTIKITCTGATEYVQASITLKGLPDFTVSPTALSFSVVGTDIPAPESLNIDGSGWTSTEPTWVSLSPSESQGPLTVASAGVNAAALANMAGGNYSGVITLTPGCSLMSPVDIPVSLSYIKGGTVSVTTNNADATFTITGPESYEGSGTSFQADGVAEGAYTVSFSKVAGFKTPETVQIQVTNGGTSTVDGKYTDLRKNDSIILSKMNVGSHETNEVAIHQPDGTLIGSFPVELSSNTAVVHGSSQTITASGDFDGDGVDDIAVVHDNGMITGYKADGTVMSGFEFMAFQDIDNVDLAAADLDGDGRDELIVGTGTGRDRDAAVRVFSYTGGTIADTGVYFLSSALRNGVEVATGDINGDGVEEIVTASLNNQSADIRIWSVNTSAGIGGWTATDSGGFTVAADDGLDIATGDMDADGTTEIVVAYNGKSEATIAIYGASGNSLGSFLVKGLYSVFLASGDTNFDGTAEIVVSSATDRDPRVVVYQSDGTVLSEFKGFENSDTKGARVSLGQVVAR